MKMKSGQFWIVLFRGSKTIVKIADNPNFFYSLGNDTPHSLTSAEKWIKQIKI